MPDFLDKLREREYLLSQVLVFGAACIVKFGFLFSSGIGAADDSKRYLRWGENFSNLDPEFLHGFFVNIFYYCLYPAFIGLHKLVSDDPLVFVFSQNLISALSLCLLFHVLYKTTSCLPALIAIAIYLLNYDLIMWDNRILTDSLYVSLSVFLVYCAWRFLCQYSRDSRFKTKGFGLFLLAVLLLCLTRPTAFPVAAATALFVLVMKVGDSKRLVPILVAGAILLTPLALSKMSVVKFIHLRFTTGEVISQRLETYVKTDLDFSADHARPESVSANHLGKAVFFYEVLLKRLAYFWAFTLDGYSRLHSLVNILYYSVFWLLCALGLRDFYGGSAARKSEGLFAGFLLTMVVAIWLFHTIAFIDFDLRYRAPTFAFLIYFVAQGAQFLLRKLKLVH